MNNRNSIVRWVFFACAWLALAAPIATATAQAADPAIAQAAAYIRSQQQPDGSFAGFGPGSTADAIYALAAADVNVAEVRQGGSSAVDFIRAQTAEGLNDVGVAAKFVIAMLLSGQSPALADGTSLVDVVQRGYDPATGLYGKDVTSHAYSIIALRAAGAEIRPEAIEKLATLQLPDGSFSFDGTAETGSDTNTTSVAVQALIAAGGQDETVRRAIDYLRTQQNADGGFPYSQTSQFGNASDANSTALTIQALIAAGEDLAAYSREGTTPIDRLRAFQNPSGAFRYQDAMPDDNAFATYQAVPALARETLPLEPLAIAFTTPAEPAPAPAVPTTPEVAQPAAAPAQLPNTGAADSLPLAVAVGALLLVCGFALRRRVA